MQATGDHHGILASAGGVIMAVEVMGLEPPRLLRCERHSVNVVTSMFA
jgi:hypothetical protein